jgi:nitrite reductase/ring-hydroxylating ferredoxin subunit
MTDAPVPVVDLADLERDGRRRVTVDGRPIALFHHDGEVRAVDNRCPHMGFPLDEGTVEDGVLTCHWHHARFELACGATFDPWADDVRTYPVEVVDGTVYVDPDPATAESPAERWRERLEDGLERNLRLVVAKSVVGLRDAGVGATTPLAQGVRFGVRYRRDGWGPGLTTLTAVGNVLPSLAEADRRRALTHGLTAVADDCAGAPPRFRQDPFPADVPVERLRTWLRETVDVRDADGTERVLRTAVRTCDEAELAELLVDAATDHRYLDDGHTLDFVNKAFESLAAVDDDVAPDVFASLVPALVDAERNEESSAWRAPVDLAARLRETFDRLDDLRAAGRGSTWAEPDGFVDDLLADDPETVVGRVEDAVADGAAPADLAAAVARAAARRLAQFSTVNEFGDWETVHHTFTYANAVHALTERTDATVCYRAVLDGAVSVYLDRFLNVPPADLPPARPDSDPEACLSDLEATFDAEGGVDRAGRAVAGYLDAGGDPDRLLGRLGHLLVREDAGFHAVQSYEAAHRQFRGDNGGRTALVGAARYLAAHFPTRREREQTFTIAARLQRGERIHEA